MKLRSKQATCQRRRCIVNAEHHGGKEPYLSKHRANHNSDGVLPCQIEQNKEVLVRIAYNGAMAKAAAKRAIQEELNEKSEEIHKKLDEILGW